MTEASEQPPATVPQTEYLRRLGVDPKANLESLDKKQASLWIEEVLAVTRGGPERPDLMTVPPGGWPGVKPAQRATPDEPQAPPPAPKGKAPDDTAAFKTALEVLENQQERAPLTLEQVTLLKSLGKFPQDASPTEMAFGMAVANRLNLSPLRRQIRFIRFASDEPIEPFVTIDGLQAIAARTGQYAGIDKPTFDYDKDGKMVAASATAYRMVNGQRCPFSSFVLWDEFARKKRSGDLTRAWTEMPMHMLGKVARAHALRIAFPEELGGVFEESEAPQED